MKTIQERVNESIKVLNSISPTAAHSRMGRLAKVKHLGKGLDFSDLDEIDFAKVREMFKPWIAENISLRQESERKIITGKMDNPELLDVGDFSALLLGKVLPILAEPSKHEPLMVVTCLLLITGRRTAEICGTTGLFPDGSYTGTVKGGGSGKSPYLLGFEYVKNGLDYITLKGLRNLTPDEVNMKISQDIKLYVDKLFPNKNAHELRKIYAAYQAYQLESQGVKPEALDRLVESYLAHSFNSESTRTYRVYKFVNLKPIIMETKKAVVQTEKSVTKKIRFRKPSQLRTLREKRKASQAKARKKEQRLVVSIRILPSIMKAWKVKYPNLIAGKVFEELLLKQIKRK